MHSGGGALRTWGLSGQCSGGYLSASFSLPRGMSEAGRAAGGLALWQAGFPPSCLCISARLQPAWGSVLRVQRDTELKATAGHLPSGLTLGEACPRLPEPRFLFLPWV